MKDPKLIKVFIDDIFVVCNQRKRRVFMNEAELPVILKIQLGKIENLCLNIFRCDHQILYILLLYQNIFHIQIIRHDLIGNTFFFNKLKSPELFNSSMVLSLYLKRSK